MSEVDYLSGMCGTRLSGIEFYEGVLLVTDLTEIEYDWVPGIVITKFLASLKESKI